MQRKQKGVDTIDFSCYSLTFFCLLLTIGQVAKRHCDKSIKGPIYSESVQMVEVGFISTTLIIKPFNRKKTR